MSACTFMSFTLSSGYVALLGIGEEKGMGACRITVVFL